MKILWLGLASCLKALDVPAGYKDSMNALLSATLDPNDYNKLVTHGCWCVNFKLSSGSKYGTGGKNTVDEIDAICKQWFFSRKCLRISGEACYDVININNNGYSIDNDDNCVDVEECPNATCQVDKFYVGLIFSKIQSLDVQLTAPGECPVNPIPHELVCGGQMPEFEQPKTISVSGIDKFREELKQSVQRLKFSLSNTWSGPIPESGNLNDLFGAKKSDNGVHVNAVSGKLTKRKRRANSEPTAYSLLNHPNCGSIISTVRNQGGTQTGWAFTSAEIIEDTTCISSNGGSLQYLSPQYLASCCLNCRGMKVTSGGWAYRAINEYINKGVPTGSDSNNELRKGYGSGCYPYALALEGEAQTAYDDQSQDGICHDTCIDGSPLSAAKHGRQPGGKISRVYINDADIVERKKHAKHHLMTHGPLIIWFQVYADFLVYGKGVYSKHNNKVNKYIDNHFLKVVGWGREGGDDYWLCLNSFGPGWAKAAGKVKIKMGTANMDLEGFHGIKFTCPDGWYTSEKGRCEAMTNCEGQDMLITKYESPTADLTQYLESGICKAHHSANQMVLKFVNNAPFSIKLWWPNYNAEMKDYGSILSGHFSTYNIYTHHAWVLQNSVNGQYLGIFTSPANLPAFSFYTLTVLKSGRLTLHQDFCDRIINTSEVGQVNAEGMYKAKFCKSFTTQKPLELRFINNMSTTITAYWLDTNGIQSSTIKTTIKPGRTITYKSMVGHAWIIRGNDGGIITLFGTPENYDEPEYELKIA